MQHFLLLLFLGLVIGQTPLVSQCVDTGAGGLCFNIDSQGCFELTGSVTLAGVTLFGPATVPIADLLTEIQNQKDDPLICYGLQQSLYGSCSICATVDQLQFDGNSIHYCGTGFLNCSNALTNTLSQTFDIPCFDLENCGFFDCRNDCNGRGTCSSLGICGCYPGYYGYDCSVELSENCLTSFADSTCWNINNCDETIDVAITTSQANSVQTFTPSEFTKFDIIPCKTVIQDPNLQCDMCVTMEQIHPEGTGFYGCPTISVTCNSILARKDSLDCINIPASRTNCQKIIPDDTTSNSGSSMYIYGIGFLGLLLLLGVGYLIVKRLGLLSKPQEDLYIEDEAPLNSEY